MMPAELLCLSWIVPSLRYLLFFGLIFASQALSVDGWLSGITSVYVGLAHTRPNIVG